MKKWLWVALSAWGCAKQPVLLPPAPTVASAPTALEPSASSSSTAPPAAAVVESAPWLSLYGVSIRLPRGWKDETEYGFRNPSRRKGHLAFGSEAELSPKSAADKQSVMLDLAAKQPDLAVSDVRTSPTPFGDASLFDVTFGDAPDAETLALVVIPHQPFWVSLSLRGTRRDVAQLPAALATLQALPEGELLPPPGRYSAFGFSFSWPQPLSPSYFSFSSEERRARLRVQWQAEQSPLEELDWNSQFSVPPTETPRLLRVEQGALHSTPVAPPRGFSVAPIAWTQLARIVQVNGYDGFPQVLTFLHANAKVGERYLKLEYYDEDRQRSTLDEAYEIIGTVHAQQ